MTSTRNDDLIPLIGEAYEAFAKGDRVKASAFRAKINIKLKKRGDDPQMFWKTLQHAMEQFHAKDGFVPNDKWHAFHA